MSEPCPAIFSSSGLDGWRIRRATQTAAAGLAGAATPQWQAFAQRDAELAATLGAD
ncbi:hypothetical protein [Hamadaea tsunoensis]|uniref:hypothetical protein n=1 Tax=Hamadaea tsunoensis TaxID=53368 RepID=UPI00041B8602|nr:hypothetical protein [Hamadaea tsunoensis]